MTDLEGLFDNDTYDKFEIIIKKVKLVDGIYEVCDIYINGKSYIDMIADDERSSGINDSVCGSYIGLLPRYILLPEGKEFVNIQSNLTMEDDGRVHTLACDLCGESECHTVRAKIIVSNESVIWSDIGLKTGNVGPFKFKRDQYEQALDYGNAAYFSACCYANGIYLEKNIKMMKKMFIEAISRKNPQAIIDLQSINKISYSKFPGDIQDENNNNNFLYAHDDKLEEKIEKEIFLILSKCNIK